MVLFFLLHFFWHHLNFVSSTTDRPSSLVSKGKVFCSLLFEWEHASSKVKYIVFVNCSALLCYYGDGTWNWYMGVCERIERIVNPCGHALQCFCGSSLKRNSYMFNWVTKDVFRRMHLSVGFVTNNFITTLTMKLKYWKYWRPDYCSLILFWNTFNSLMIFWWDNYLHLFLCSCAI